MNKLLFILSFFCLVSSTFAVQGPSKANLILAYRMKNTFLVQAAAQGNETLGLALLKMPGIDVNHVDGTGKSALFYARNNHLSDLVRELILLGAH